MATNQRRTNQTTANRARAGQNRPAPQARIQAVAKKKKSKVKIIVFAIEIVIILIMLAVLYFVMNISDKGPIWLVIDPEELAIPEEIQQAKEDGNSQMADYMNIALFGVDALNEKQFRKLQANEQDAESTKSTGIRSDSTMIASINMATGDIKLVSVYRDTYLNTGTDRYEKCNAAFSRGGPKQAMKMLNMNLDMDIEKFVAVSYGGVIELIDALGGVWIDVDKSELKHINNYQKSIVASWKYGIALTDDTDPSVIDSKVKKSDYTPVTETGYQLLNGLQATAYCRIRYTAGNDYKRAERQREVLQAIEAQAKSLAKKNPAELTKIFNSVIENVCTNIEVNDMLALLGKILDYQVVGQDGFPQADLRVSHNIGAKGDCVIPRDLEANVVWLHKFLFDEDDYEVTKTVKEINQQIKDDTNKYLNN